MADVSARLDLLGRTGDARLAGRAGRAAARHPPGLAGAPAGGSRSACRWPGGSPTWSGCSTRLHRPFPDEERRAGLVTAGGRGRPGRAARGRRRGPDRAHRPGRRRGPRAGRLVRAPRRRGRAARRGAAGAAAGRACVRRSTGLIPTCARPAAGPRRGSAYALGRIATAEEAPGARAGAGGPAEFPRLVVMVGPSGSGKSTFARGLPGVDDRRLAGRPAPGPGRPRPTSGPTRTSCATGLDRLDALLAGGGTVVLGRHRAEPAPALPGARGGPPARRADHARRLLVAGEDVLARRNAGRDAPGAVRGARRPARAASPRPTPARRTAPGTSAPERDGRRRRRSPRRRRMLMRTSEEIYHRIRWDPRFDPARFVLGVNVRGGRPQAGAAARLRARRRHPVAPGAVRRGRRRAGLGPGGRAGPDRLLAGRPGARPAHGCGRRSSPPGRRTPGTRPRAGGRPSATARRRRPGRPPPRARLRVLTWNTLWDRYDSDRIDTARRRPLLLAALDAPTPTSSPCRRSRPGCSTLLLAAPWVRAGYTLGTDPAGQDVDDSGLLLLSRLPVREAGLHVLGPHKAVAAVTVQTAAGPLVVAATHLSSDHSDARRRTGARPNWPGSPRGWPAWTGDVVLLGDFNDGARHGRPAGHARPARRLDRGARPRRRDAHLRPAGQPAGRRLLALRPGLPAGPGAAARRATCGRPRPCCTATSPAPDGLFVSDHYGVAAERRRPAAHRSRTSASSTRARPPGRRWPGSRRRSCGRRSRRSAGSTTRRSTGGRRTSTLLFGFVPESDFERGGPAARPPRRPRSPRSPPGWRGCTPSRHRDDATVWLDPAAADADAVGRAAPGAGAAVPALPGPRRGLHPAPDPGPGPGPAPARRRLRRAAGRRVGAGRRAGPALTARRGADAAAGRPSRSARARCAGSTAGPARRPPDPDDAGPVEDGAARGSEARARGTPWRRCRRGCGLAGRGGRARRRVAPPGLRAGRRGPGPGGGAARRGRRRRGRRARVRAALPEADPAAAGDRRPGAGAAACGSTGCDVDLAVVRHRAARPGRGGGAPRRAGRGRRDRAERGQRRGRGARRGRRRAAPRSPGWPGR